MGESLRPATRAETPAAPSAVPRERAAVLALVIGLDVSALAPFLLHAHEHHQASADFAPRTPAFAHLASDRSQRHQDSPYGLRNLFPSSGDATRQEFAGAAHDLISRQVGVQAIAGIVRVPAAGRARVDTAGRAKGFPDFAFIERATPAILRPAAARPDHFPVLFIEPCSGNEPALGFDLTSGITRAHRRELAGTGELGASGRRPLLDHRGGASWGHLMQIPVSWLPLAAAPAAERRARHRARHHAQRRRQGTGPHHRRRHPRTPRPHDAHRGRRRGRAPPRPNPDASRHRRAPRAHEGPASPAKSPSAASARSTPPHASS